ncbi:hypothetical protein HAX54_033308 [Datura stramonium]|uniref:Uncharacterized protein n=1 Tax=Datura stramonium TaxID=4076 RepID=A0ABS8SDC8_DATST|nr:hypothetical protein [Datura stramonium]
MLKISSGTRLTLINQLKFPSKLKEVDTVNFHIHLTELATLPELRCRYLKVFPSRFEDSSSLKSVELISSNEELVGSAMAVRETLAGISGNSGFEIIIRK